MIGTDVPYAQIHNEGFRGNVNIKAHVRKRYRNEKEGTGVYSTRTRKERTRTKRVVDSGHTVQSHTRKINMPKRQFMGSSAVLDKQIERMMNAEFNKALK